MLRCSARSLAPRLAASINYRLLLRLVTPLATGLSIKGLFEADPAPCTVASCLLPAPTVSGSPEAFLQHKTIYAEASGNSRRWRWQLNRTGGASEAAFKAAGVVGRPERPRRAADSGTVFPTCQSSVVPALASVTPRHAGLAWQFSISFRHIGHTVSGDETLIWLLLGMWCI